MMYRNFFAPLLALLASLAVVGVARAQAQAQAPQRASLVGKTMQPAAVDLQQLRGKVVMLFFWSTACPVCLDKLPELRRNLQGWRGKDFVIVAVSQDRSMDDLKAYEQVLDRISPPDAQMKIVWRRDPAHRDSFGELPSNTPTTVILDRNGVISKMVRGRVAPELWDDVAELILN
jgi:peroxiredoxin